MMEAAGKRRLLLEDDDDDGRDGLHRHYEEVDSDREEPDLALDLDLDPLRATERRGRVKLEGYDDSTSESGTGSEPEFPTPMQAAIEGEIEEAQEGEEGEEAERMAVNSADRTEANEIPLEPFNMRGEMEEGHFDRESGSYVLERDASTRDDAWLATVGTAESIQRARAAKAAREEAAIVRERTAQSAASMESLVAELIVMLDLGECPMEAIQRRTPTVRRKFDAKSRRQMATQSAEQATQDAQKRQEIDRITALCGALMDHGLSTIYELTKEELSRLYPRR